jgi:hypothetical protein
MTGMERRKNRISENKREGKSDQVQIIQIIQNMALWGSWRSTKALERVLAKSTSRSDLLLRCTFLLFTQP